MEFIGERMKRLKIQSWRRGMKEVDLILGTFFETQGTLLSKFELDLYERLLDQDDQIIFNWISEKSDPPDEFYSIVQKINLFTQSAPHSN